MKKLLLTTLALVAVLCVNAQTEKFYNFSDWDAADYSAVTVVDGLIINASAAGVISIDANNKSIDGYSFTKRIKLGGGGEAISGGRNIAFEVTGAVQITVYGMASSASATDRRLIISNGTDVLYSEIMLGDPIGKHEYSYTGGAATLYLLSSSSGLNFYGIKIVQSPASVNNPSDVKEVLSTRTFDVLGKEVPADTKGLVFVKTTYKDGTTGAQKIYRK